MLQHEFDTALWDTIRSVGSSYNSGSKRLSVESETSKRLQTYLLVLIHHHETFTHHSENFDIITLSITGVHKYKDDTNIS